MNGLEKKDMCIPKNNEEYLIIHKRLQDAGIATYRSYEFRVSQDGDGFREYPQLSWNGSTINGHRFRIGHINDHYNLMSVTEFLTKAGVKGHKHTYGKGDPLKHRFI